MRHHLLAALLISTIPGPAALARGSSEQDTATERDGGSLETGIIFLQKGGMGAQRALTLYERVLGQAGEGSATVGRQPNVLVVRDTPERLARFRALIKALDRPGAERRLYLRPLAHLAPSQAAQLLSELMPPGVQVVPDDRTGQLIVSATLDDYRRLDQLVRRLDAPGQGRQIRVTPGPSEGGFPP